MTILWLDCETYSATPIKNGTNIYAENSEVMIITYALDDGAVVTLDLTEENLQTGEPYSREMNLFDYFTDELIAALQDPDVIVYAQNSYFDRSVFRENGYEISRGRWRDSMVQALAHSLPAGLAELCDVLGVSAGDAKDKEGRSYILLFCKPNKDGTRNTRHTHPVQWKGFLKYAGSDITAMRACVKKMPTINYSGQELALWHLDQKINDRGVLVDTDLARGAITAVEAEKHNLARRTQEITDEQVKSATQRDAMLKFILEAYGVELPDMRKSTLERRIEDPDLPLELRELLAIRLQSTGTSIGKYRTLVKAVNKDGRLRGTLQFCGASRTGRWSGRLFQPQNMPRPTMKQKQIEIAIHAFKSGCADLLTDNVTELASNAVRGTMIAPEGKKLVVSDLSNIESRVLTWLAGEDWKIKAFEDLDAGTGHDLYRIAYAKAFGIDPSDVDGEQRQVGKILELSLGYASGVGGLLTFALAYGMDMEAMADTILENVSPEIKESSIGMLQWTKKKRRSTFGLSDKAYLACESLKQSWRAAHPRVVSFWAELEETVRRAILNPNVTYDCGLIKVRRQKAWLYLRLPSGRCLCYPAIKVGDDNVISYQGKNQYSRRWEKIRTYSGKLVENCIAKGTEVLTESGWLAIEQLSANLKVWDGVEWVSHSGLSYNGVQSTIEAYGVSMTPDHLVLTEKGWINASSCERLNRAQVGLPNGYTLPSFGEQAPVYVGGSVCLRNLKRNGCIRIRQAAKEGYSSFLRLFTQSFNRQQNHETRHESSSGLWSLARHVGQMPSSIASCVRKLRGSRHYSVRLLERRFSKLLAGHGKHLFTRFDFRAQGQQFRLQPFQLLLGYAYGAEQQYTKERFYRNSERENVYNPSHGGLRVKENYIALSARKQLANASSVNRVYDLINCGPRNRFVVRGKDCLPLIVHNCCQGVARDVMAYNMPEIENRGYEILLTVHDELITEAPDTPEFNAEDLSTMLSASKPWSKGLPLASAGFESKRYRKG